MTMVVALLTLMAGWAGPISLLPLTAGILFTWFIDTRSDLQLKAVIIAAQLLWACYDLYYRTYVSFTFDILTILTNLIAILVMLRGDGALHFAPYRKKKSL